MKIKPLQKGDTIAIVAPSGALILDELKFGIDFLEQNGFQVQLGKNLFNQSGIGYNFAGTEKERIQDFQQAIDNKNIKAIWCARGGYGAVKIIDELDFSSLKNDFKWIIGYSDITIFHNQLNQLEIPSLHAITAKNYSPKNSIESYKTIKTVLFNQPLFYELELKNTRFRETEGILIGGNLSILYSQMGVLTKKFFTDKILFIEDWYLKRNGIFNEIKAIIVGSFTKMDNEKTNPFYHQDFDSIAYQIIEKELSMYDFPMIFGFPAGHISDNRSLIMGAKLKIEKKENNLNFSFKY
jgi:muramoyltetrapeptide carboxypeptidase